MRLLCVTDLHGATDVLERILGDAGRVDGVLLGGDITSFGTPNSAEYIVRRVQREYECVWAVAGNCDSPSIDKRLVELGVSIFGRGAVSGDIGFYGVSAMPPWHGTMYELTEGEIATALETGFSQLGDRRWDVLLTHTPPRDTPLDRTWRGSHVGSTAVREFIGRHPPHLLVCGHIHESRGTAQLGPTQMVNCGAAYEGHYALVDLAEEIRVDLRSVAQELAVCGRSAAS